jgi:hypothetical protein
MRVLFDEAHSEAWTIRPELAAVMQPTHPGDASFALAADALRAEGFDVGAQTSGSLTGEVLGGASVLVIAHPSDPAWERTTGTGAPRLTEAELDAIEAYVARGGGLIVLGETEQEKYGNNLNELLSRFGLHLENDTVQDYEHNAGAPSWVLAALGDGGRGMASDLLARVPAACLYRATTVAITGGGIAGARVIARTHRTASAPDAPLIVASEHGDGRIAVLADSDLFGDDCLEQLGHRDLLLNLVYWAAGGSPDGEPATGSDALRDPAWEGLRTATDELAAMQAPDGSLRVDAEAARAASLVRGMVDSIETLAPRFAHQSAYLQAVVEDLRRWVADGFPKPDFGPSLEELRPERDRRDGIEHLIVLPMYKQNASRDTCFEALIVRVPWPEWIARLEDRRYGNPQFVPVELAGYTRGYESECAVLFPETVSVAERAPNNFGAIFCDREAERLRRVAGDAAELLALNLPPDAAYMLRSPAVARDAYILWDLIHDRTHSHGDLPFDPFMVRQRAPYWMYSLEELRCDLTAFGEAVALEHEGVRFARFVQYAILLDRLLRFPITGERVRNYDGLGGQLLFAFLHTPDGVGAARSGEAGRRAGGRPTGWLHWTDNRLTIEWDTVADGVGQLRTAVAELYRAGIDRSKLAHWGAAHDLVSRYVPPASGSKWVAPVRDLAEVEDPRPYCDLVLPDEFPLSIFYSALRAKLVRPSETLHPK